MDKYYLDKERVALIVVFLDVVISLMMFFLFQFLRAIQVLEDSEINEAIVQAQDFAVELRNLPPHTTVRTLKAQMWSWMESVNEKEKTRELNPATENADENQDTMMNI